MSTFDCFSDLFIYFQTLLLLLLLINSFIYIYLFFQAADVNLAPLHIDTDMTSWYVPTPMASDASSQMPTPTNRLAYDPREVQRFC